MDRQDKHRRVHQYVERQKAYIPTYTREDPWNEHHATPSKQLRCDEFGFDTPVLRPRVPVNKTSQSQTGEQAEPSKQAHKTGSRPPGPEGAPSETQAPQPPSNKDKDKPRSKRKKALTPIDTDDEQATRLANRRERKRKKRAIVNPRVPSATPQKGKKHDQKAKKPAALALMYGFSATNVTKDRLTLKPAPCLGVFSKGKASAKKQVTTTKKTLSKNDIFSELAFLNKPSEKAADHSKVDDSDSSVSSVSNDSAPQVTHKRNRTNKERDKGAETIASKKATTCESEVWDIELQSELPSSARDVSSVSGVDGSVPVVVDLRKAGWSTSLEPPRNKTRARSLSMPPSSLPARSEHDGHDVLLAVDGAPSIHPSHSASQIGYRGADVQPSESRRVRSKYFVKPVPAPQLAAAATQPSRSNDDDLEVLDFRMDQDAQGTAMEAETNLGIILPAYSPISVAALGTRANMAPLEFPSDDLRIQDRDATMAILQVASPINSLISEPMPLEFGPQFDVAPLEFSSDYSPYGDCYDVPLERLDHGYLESSALGLQHVDLKQDTGWDSYCTGSANDDVEYDLMQGYTSLAPGTVSADELAVCGPDRAQVCESWSQMTGDDESIWQGRAEFLEGRALPLGVPEWPGQVGLSGLAQAEMDVANGLRDHWRRVRLS